MGLGPRKNESVGDGPYLKDAPHSHLPQGICRNEEESTARAAASDPEAPRRFARMRLRMRVIRARETFPTIMLSVNGQVIEDALLDAEFSEIKAFYERQGNVSCCERNDEFQGYAKDNIISRVLLTADAVERMPEPTPDEIREAIERAKAEHGGEEAFYSHLGIAPGEEDVLLPEIVGGLKLDRLIAELTAEVPEPTDEDIQAYHQAHLSEYTRPAQVRASHIFKSLERVERREEILDELRGVRLEALGGTDFHELARIHSDKPEDEVDLGFFKRGELMDEFEIIVFSMETGEISPVFATPFGLHMAKVTERREAAPIPLEECREAVIEAWKQEQRQEHVKSHIAGLREKAVIKDDTPAPEGHSHL